MKNLYKALIVWLLLVAIPFQGFAAASMLACAPAPVVAVTTAHCVQMSGQMPHAAHHDGIARDSGADHSSHRHTPGKCTTCASCFGAVMAPPMQVLPVPGAAPELAIELFTDGHLARVDLALPERPPKAVLI